METPVKEDVPSKRSNSSILNAEDADSSRAQQQRTKKSKTTSTSSRPAAPPPYGSHEYWDNRYRKQFQTVNAICQGASAVAAVHQDDRKGVVADAPTDQDHHGTDHQRAETLPFHNWYFSYEELRVLILPLILGGRKEAFSIVAGESSPAEDPEDQGGDVDSSDDTRKGADGTLAGSTQRHGNERTKHQLGISNNEAAEGSSSSGPGSAEKQRDSRNGVGQSLEGTSDTVVADADHHTSGNDDDEEEDLEECEVIEEGESDDDDEEEDVDREGLARDGPISVLEVGCGDVPLSCGLLAELVKLSKVTGVSHQAIVGRLVATDYSSVVIDAMKKAHSSTEDTGGVLQFETVDARKMPYTDGTFDLVLEKGVLDAMLSDTDEGTENCVQIVRECGRVLSTGGVLVLVSHLNANTPNGVQWIENVVMPGLSTDDDDDASNVAWEIEVHGSDGNPSCDGSDESVDSLSPGPAVYIIHKRNREGDEPASQAFELKFFVY